MFKRLWKRFFENTNETLGERIRKFHGISEMFTFNVLMGTVAVYFLGIDKYVSRDQSVSENLAKLAIFFEENYLPFSLAALTIIWFSLYRRAVKNEMEFLINLFSQINPPRDWQAQIGIAQVPLLAVAIPATFFVLVACSKVIPLYCIIVIVLNFMDARGNSVVRQLITAMTLDKRLDPPKEDPTREFILRRRAVAEEYWIGRPQIERIALMMIANGTALILASGSLEQTLGISLWQGVPYIIIIGAVAANELTIAGWRQARDEKIDHIRRDFDDFTARVGGGAAPN